jgi:hypothetical protein
MHWRITFLSFITKWPDTTRGLQNAICPLQSKLGAARKNVAVRADEEKRSLSGASDGGTRRA